MSTKRYCPVCHAMLQGKQTRFCSDTHRSVYWNELRKRAIELPAPAPDPEAEELFRDLWSVIQRHGATIKRLLK